MARRRTFPLLIVSPSSCFLARHSGFGGVSGRSLVLPGDRISGRLHQGDLDPGAGLPWGVRVVTAVLLYLNLRLAQRGLVPDPVVFRVARTGRRARPHRVLRRLSGPGRDRLRPAGGVRVHRRLGDCAPGHLRARRSAWPIRSSGATSATTSSPCPRSRRCSGFLLERPGARACCPAGADLLAPRRHRDPASAQLAGRAVGRAAPGRARWPRCSCCTALRLWLVDIPSLLYSTTGPLVGASYTDLHATLPALRISAVAGARRGRRGRGRRGARGSAGPVRALAPSAATWWSAFVGRGLVPLADAEVHRRADRADPGDALPRATTSRPPASAWGLDSVETRELNGEADADPGRHPGQRADHRERAALGSRSAAADLRPAAGDPDLLRLRLGGRRPLLDRRQVPPGAALAPGAQRRVAADPDLHQRAPDLHPRHGTHPGPGQPGDDRRPAGAVRQGPAAGLDRVAQGHPAADLLRRAGQRLRLRQHPAAGVRPSRRARTTSTPPTTGTGGVRVGQPASAACCSRVRFGSSKILFSQDITDEQPGPLLPQHHGPGAKGAAVPAVRSRSLPGDRRTTARSSGSSTPIPRTDAVSLLRSGSATAPATCATASRW